MTLPQGSITTKIIFPVTDVATAAAFYGDLGFEVERYDDGYAWVRHQGDEVLHLRFEPDLDPSANPTVGYFHVADANQWHSALAGTSAPFGPVQDRPWGMREFTLTDPWGNVTRFGQNL